MTHTQARHIDVKRPVKSEPLTAGSAHTPRISAQGGASPDPAPRPNKLLKRVCQYSNCVSRSVRPKTFQSRHEGFLGNHASVCTLARTIKPGLRAGVLTRRSLMRLVERLTTSLYVKTIGRIGEFLSVLLQEPREPRLCHKNFSRMGLTS